MCGTPVQVTEFMEFHQVEYDLPCSFNFMAIDQLISIIHLYQDLT